MDLTVDVHEEGTGFWARVVELPGCFASGDTLKELHEALGEAVGLYLWDRPARLLDQPLTAGRVSIAVAPGAGDDPPGEADQER